MAKAVEKLIDLKYDELITIGVIEKDADLKGIFTDEVKLSFPMLKTLAKENGLSKDVSSLLKTIFDHVILTKKDLISKYILLADTQGENIKIENAGIEIVQEEPVSIEIEDIKEKNEEIIAEIKPVKVKKEKAIPRRYGKEKILKDIEANGGKISPLQNAMLKVNTLKNIYVNLSARGVKDMCANTKLLSDEDCRTIISVVTIAERKLEEILKRK